MLEPRWLIVWLFLLSLLQGCGSPTGEVVSLGTLERDRIELTAEIDERITRVFVTEGDIVDVGDPLVQQDTARADIALVKARADEAVARSALIAAEAGPRQQQIAGARARLEAAISNRRTTELELVRAQSLVDRNLTSKNAVDLLTGQFNTATAGVEEATALLDELLEGTRTEEIDQARSRHAAALAVVQDLQLTLERATSRAPVAGVIEALPYDVGERPGHNATLAVMLASGRTYARIHLSEPLRNRLSVGSKAEIRLDGYDNPLPGHVRWIASTAAFTPYYALHAQDRSRLSYLAEIDLEADSADLPIGVPVEVRFPDL